MGCRCNRTPVVQTAANTVCREAHRASFRQLFNFSNYADNAKTLTWCGMISGQNALRSYENCRFEELAYIRSGDDALHVRIRDFTAREWLHFEHQVAGSKSRGATIPGITTEDVRAFAEVYRWKAS